MTYNIKFTAEQQEILGPFWSEAMTTNEGRNLFWIAASLTLKGNTYVRIASQWGMRSNTSDRCVAAYAAAPSKKKLKECAIILRLAGYDR